MKQIILALAVLTSIYTIAAATTGEHETTVDSLEIVGAERTTTGELLTIKLNQDYIKYYYEY